MLSRRSLVHGGALFATSLAAAFSGVSERARAAGSGTAFAAALAHLEGERGGRLGVAVLDTGSGAGAGHRADEAFPMCSTFKLLAAAAILARVDAGQDNLARRIRFAASDLVDYSPVTEAHAGGEGMTLAQLCEAAMTVSDNTAANLLLGVLGGPPGLTAYARSLGDHTTRLDRIEPGLNEALPGDPRDTTAPGAMLEDLRRLVLGNALTPQSRDQLIAWLVGNKTGDTRLRAGVPRTWRVGDKTGSGERGTANDVAVMWPPGRAPILAAVYYTGSSGSAAERNAMLAAVGKVIALAVAG